MTASATETIAPIHKTGRTGSGARMSAGYYAINPGGHLVLLPVRVPLKPGWRLATSNDLAAKQAAAAAAAIGKDSEAGRQSQRAAGKRGRIEAAGEKLTISDEDLARAHELGDIKHPWPAEERTDP